MRASSAPAAPSRLAHRTATGRPAPRRAAARGAPLSPAASVAALRGPLAARAPKAEVPRAARARSALAVLVAAALGGTASGCTTTDPTGERGRTVWRDVLGEALDLAAEDRAEGGVDRRAVEAEVSALAGQMRQAATRRLDEERARPGARVVDAAEGVAHAVAEVLFGAGGLTGDPADPAGLSRDLFDPDRVLLRRRGTCLAVVVVGLAAAEEAGLEVAPVLAPGHALLAVAPGFVVDPATASVARPAPGMRPSGPDELRADLYANRASYRRAAGDLDGALADVDRAVELAPRLSTARVNRAATLLDLGRTAEAVSDLERVEAAGEGSSVLAFNLALASARLEQMGVAKHWYRVATERDPRSVAAWVNRGALHAALGEPVAAESALEQALRLDPGNLAARAALDRLREPRPGGAPANAGGEPRLP